MSLLEIENASVARAGTTVVRNVSLSVPPASITVLLGPNGAGKSSLLDAVAGVEAVSAGAIRFDGVDLRQLNTRERFQLGIAYVEQGRTVFPGLSVRKNIEAAASSGLEVRKALDETLEHFPELEKRLDVPAGMLSGGEQQMVVLGRALLSDPKLLLIDELSLGLAPIVVQRFMPLLIELKKRGVAVLLVEQYANAALAIGDGAAVLAHGELVLTETCERLRSDPHLLHKAYLG